MKSESPFFNPYLTKQMNRFSAVAEIRFSLLDKFNKDCRTLTKMLEKYAVPALDWVWVEPDNAETFYGLGWHDGTIVWADNDGMAELTVDQLLPIYEAPAHVRSWLAEHNVLPLLFQDACLALEELADKMKKPKPVAMKDADYELIAEDNAITGYVTKAQLENEILPDLTKVDGKPGIPGKYEDKEHGRFWTIQVNSKRLKAVKNKK